MNDRLIRPLLESVVVLCAAVAIAGLVTGTPELAAPGLCGVLGYVCGRQLESPYSWVVLAVGVIVINWFVR